MAAMLALIALESQHRTERYDMLRTCSACLFESLFDTFFEGRTYSILSSKHAQFSTCDMMVVTLSASIRRPIGM